MTRLITAIRRSIAAALHAGRSLVSAACRYGFRLLVDLYRAIDTGAAVVIGYRKPDGEASTRAVRPLDLTVSAAGNILLRAYDHRDAEDTTFRVDRITHHQTAEEATVSRPVNLDQPTETLRHQRDLITDVVASGDVRPEMATALGDWADRIDTELASRATAA